MILQFNFDTKFSRLSLSSLIDGHFLKSKTEVLIQNNALKAAILDN